MGKAKGLVAIVIGVAIAAVLFQIFFGFDLSQYK